MSGSDYLGHRLIIYTGQFALVNLMCGVKVDDELEGVQDENHKTQIMAEINICLITFLHTAPEACTSCIKKIMQMFRNFFFCSVGFVSCLRGEILQFSLSPLQMTRCQPAATWTWRTASPTWSRSCSCRRTRSSCSSRLWPTPCADWAAARSKPTACSREARRRPGGGPRPPRLQLRPPKVSRRGDEQLLTWMIGIITVHLH